MPRRVDPYKQFTFRLTLGGAVVGGFEALAARTKLKGLNKASDVTLKRGLIAAPALRDWLKRKRTISIDLQSTTHVLRWTLKGAAIAKYESEPLGAAGNDVAVDELVLTAEQIEVLSRDSNS